jgi:hypothetical protein
MGMSFLFLGHIVAGIAGNVVSGVTNNSSANLATLGEAAGTSQLSSSLGTYYLMATMMSSNRIVGGWMDINGLWMSVSGDGTNFDYAGPNQPVMGNHSPIGTNHSPVNDPTIWLGTNGAVFYTYTPNCDYSTNLLTIYRGADATSAPNTVVNIDCSSLAIGGTLSESVLEPQIDATPNIVPTNLFIRISTNNRASWFVAVSTCTNAPLYSLWTVPTAITIPGQSYLEAPCGFTYHGTNMIIFGDGTSFQMATNTTSPRGTYTTWKGYDWGGWVASNAFVHGLTSPFLLFMPDRIRLYGDVTLTNVFNPIFQPGDYLAAGLAYSDCFDNFQTWTPLKFIAPPPTLGVSNNFYRMASVIPVSLTNLVYFGIYADDGIPDLWQLQYFGLNNPNGVAAADADGTGQNNLFKYVAGLDPTNPASVLLLKVTSIPGPSKQKSLLFNPLAVGRNYAPQFSTNLTLGSWLPLTGYTGPVTNGNQVAITDTNATGPRKFYRINISLP